MKIVGLGGLVLGAFIFVLLLIFISCCIVISNGDNSKK